MNAATTTEIKAGQTWTDGARIVCVLACFVLLPGLWLVSNLDDDGRARVVTTSDLARHFTLIDGAAP